MKFREEGTIPDSAVTSAAPIAVPAIPCLAFDKCWGGDSGELAFEVENPRREKVLGYCMKTMGTQVQRLC